MRIDCSVLHENDWTCPVQTPMHLYYGAATSYAATITGTAIEGISKMGHPPGAFTGDHKLAGSVFYQRNRVVQGGHKLGILVPHVQLIPAPDNVLTIALHMPLSSWQVKFQNGEVTAEGQPLGAVELVLPMPGLLCGEPISAPCGIAPTSLMATVQHHMSLVDWIAGWAEILVQMIIELIVAKLEKSLRMGDLSDSASVIRAGWKPGRWFRGAIAGLTEKGVNKTFGQIMRDQVENVASQLGVSAVTSLGSSGAGFLVREAGQEFGYQGSASVRVAPGVGSLVGGEIQYSEGPGGAASLGGKITGPLGLTEAGYQGGYDAQGNRVAQTEGRVGYSSRRIQRVEQSGPDGSSVSQNQWTQTNHRDGSSQQSSWVDPEGFEWL